MKIRLSLIFLLISGVALAQQVPSSGGANQYSSPSAAAKTATGWTRTSGKVVLTNSTDNVGIGSTAPGQALDVNGTVRAQAFVATNASAVNTFAGNVGIGTTTPNFGGLAIGSTNNLTLSTGGSIVSVGSLTFNAPTTGHIFGNYGTAAAPGYAFNNDAGTGMGDPSNGHLLTFAANGAERVRIDSTGNVGISSVNPGQTLDVFGTARVVGTNPELTVVSASAPTYFTGYGESAINVNGSGQTFALQIAGANKVLMDSNGNLGIGSATPGQLLDVNGTIRITNTTNGALSLPYGATNGRPSIGWTSSTGVMNGIGINNQNNWFTVGGTVFNGMLLNGSNDGTAGVTNLGINYGTSTAGLGTNGVKINENVGIGTFDPFGGRLIVTGGNVGIGSVNPGQVLDVTGTVRFANSLIGTNTNSVKASIQASANQACNTTCTSGACLFGEDTSVLGSFVDCADATADRCVCLDGLGG